MNLWLGGPGVAARRAVRGATRMRHIDAPSAVPSQCRLRQLARVRVGCCANEEVRAAIPSGSRDSVPPAEGFAGAALPASRRCRTTRVAVNLMRVKSPGCVLVLEDYFVTVN